MMNFWLGDRYIRLSFEYPKQSAVTMCYLRIEIPQDDQLIPVGLFSGYALCSSKDKFSKETGRKLALRRALEMVGFDKNERSYIWNLYHLRGETSYFEIAYILAYVPDWDPSILSFDDAMALAEEREEHSASQFLESLERFDAK